MEAQAKRHISPGWQYDRLFPKSTQKDIVIKTSGQAKLSDTISLMKVMISQTLSDTLPVSKILQGKTIEASCKNIWDFVYEHIQYTMDKTGIEQVRRPSRTWADRTTGVDCDCYTVFIGSILTNMGIPFLIRITKYGGKKHYQHVYPIVFHKGRQITLDCVTDRFNHEVAYSEKKDFEMKDTKNSDGETVLSGVDTLDIGLSALEQPKLPLRRMIQPAITNQSPEKTITVQRKGIKPVTKTGRVLSPYRFEQSKTKKNQNADFNLPDFLIKAGISAGLGIGVYRLFIKDN